VFKINNVCYLLMHHHRVAVGQKKTTEKRIYVVVIEYLNVDRYGLIRVVFNLSLNAKRKAFSSIYTNIQFLILNITKEEKKNRRSRVNLCASIGECSSRL